MHIPRWSHISAYGSPDLMLTEVMDFSNHFRAEIFKAHSPLLVDDLTVFKPGLHG